MKKILIILFTILLSLNTVSASKYITVKYRDTKVDIQNGYFTCINTSKSSFVSGACYDQTNKYMLIGLKSTVYHYCNLDKTTWNSFKKASSFGTHYNKYIKGNFSCKSKSIPEYK